MPLHDQTVLIIGGTSGFGSHLTSVFQRSNKVVVTGRTNSEKEGAEFRFLELNGNLLSERLDMLVSDLPHIDILVYAAGSYERGLISEMKDEQITKMCSIYLLAPMLLISRILKKQKRLSGIIAVSSVSQRKPNQIEPVYCSLKAGFGMLGHCLSLDPAIEKVLVVAPARINKKGNGVSEGKFGKLDPLWVANIVMREYEDDFRYKFIRISRDPAKIATEREDR